MHLSLFNSRGYFSVFYRQLINNSLGNLPPNLFSNLGSLTELYVEIYMYRSLYCFPNSILISVPSSEQRKDNSLVGGGTQDRVRVLPYDFTLTRACNRRNPEQGKMRKGSGRDLRHVMIEMVLTMLHYSIALEVVFNENGRYD